MYKYYCQMYFNKLYNIDIIIAFNVKKNHNRTKLGRGFLTLLKMSI